MSTNHNRIRVADLETNQPNKILKTNQNGELEFSNANHLQVESYNALDYTAEGKALDARQGKVLKDMIDNKSVNLASDLETQINAAIPEDNKVISRSKLFNWWQWIKSQSQTVSGAWSFSNKVTLASGTLNTPSLIIPNGTLTSTPQNGAIERDESGKLWNTFSGVRNELVPTRFSKNIGGFDLLRSYIFHKPASAFNDLIEMYNSTAGSSKIYIQNFNSRDEMFNGDVLDTEFIIQNNGVAKSLILRFETWGIATMGGTPTLVKTYDYPWNGDVNSVLHIRILCTRRYGIPGVSSGTQYIFLINDVYSSFTDVDSFGNNDIRLKLVNKTSGTNNVYITPIKQTNVFVPLI